MCGMDLLAHAAAVLQAFDIEPKPLDRLLDDYFRRHRDLGSRGRRIVSEAVFGVARWRRRLDGWLVMRGLKKPDHTSRTLGYLLWKRPEGADLLPLDELACAMGVGGSFDEAMPKSFPGGEAAFVSFPDFLYDLFIEAFGKEEAYALAMKLNAPAVPVLRVNTLRANRDEVCRRLKEEGIEADLGRRSPYALWLSRRLPLESSRAYRDGIIEVQDESSQLSVLVADPKPGESVLDACAGAGGKALMMAMLMRNEGRIVASDISSPHLRELERRARRAGVQIIEAFDASVLQKRKASLGPFDLVFVDAPCSGTGTLCRSPDLKWRLTAEAIEQRVAEQRRLLSAAADAMRPGGRIVYATCSLLPCENAVVVDDFLKRGDFILRSAADGLSRHGISADDIVTKEGYLQIDPRSGVGDGFFAAVLTKR